jgi:hypothetical protein
VLIRFCYRSPDTEQLTPQAMHMSPLRGLGPAGADRPIESDPHNWVWNRRGGVYPRPALNPPPAPPGVIPREVP